MSEETPQQDQPQTPSPSAQDQAPNVKIVFLGDDGVGKTSICTFYKEGKPPSGELPVIAPNFAKKEFHDEKKAVLVLWDSACNSDYNDIRPRAYPQTNFFLLCFALNDKKSLENAVSIWMKEIQDYTKDAKVIMIGTKKDIGTLNDKSISPFRKLIDPYLYYECSSVTGENIQHIFDVITKIAIDPESVKKQIFNEEEEKKPADGTEAKNTDAKEKTTTAQKSAACLLI